MTLKFSFQTLDRFCFPEPQLSFFDFFTIFNFSSLIYGKKNLRDFLRMKKAAAIDKSM